MGTHVFVPTDLGDDAEVAWVTAMRFALARGGTVSVVHVRSGDAPPAWDHLPRAPAVLARWGWLDPGAGVPEYQALGIRLRLEAFHGDDRAATVVAAAEVEQPDLLVMTTHGSEDWWHASVAERIARGVRAPTLLLPAGGRPIVDPATGALRLRHLLVAVGGPEDQQVVDAAAAWVAALGLDDVRVTVVHAGDVADLAAFALDRPGWRWSPVVVEGGPGATVLAAARELDPDLVVMGSHGHDGLFDALLGNKSEQVARGSRVPILVVPLGPHR